MKIHPLRSKLLVISGFVTVSSLVAFYAIKKVGKHSSAPTSLTQPEQTDTTTIQICENLWTSRNLDVAVYRNGDPIPHVRDPKEWQNLTTGAWCWYNNDSATYDNTYGRLYNWYAINDARGLATEGWHVASEEEWMDLDSCIGADSLGFKLRGRGWNVPASTADNRSGFNGLPGGMRTDSGTFRLAGEGAVFWVSDAGSTNETSCYRIVQYKNNKKNHLMGTGWGYMNKTEGYSVRCVRN